jgi:hypothetical protein
MRRGGGRAKRVAALLVGVALVLLLVAQLALPRIAASRISSKVGRYGHVLHVSVSAWPAVKLLWGDADSVHVSAGRLALSPAQAAGLLWEGRGVKDMDLTAQAVDVGGLEMRDASLHKRGELLSAEARSSDAAVRAALPAGVTVRLRGSSGGRVEVQAAGALFGVGAAVDAVAEANGGSLVAHPVGSLLEGFQLTLFADRHVHVTGVGASREGAGGYRLTMDALLR